MTSSAQSGWLRLILSLAFLSCGASAPECPIENTDLTDRLESVGGARAVGSTQQVDPDSEEPIMRYVLLLAGGETAIVQQKNCEMHNLSVSVLAQEDEAAIPAIVGVLSALPTWQKWFGGTDLASAIERTLRSDAFRSVEGQPSTASLDAYVSASGEHSEVHLSRFPLDRDLTPYARMLTLTIAVGGE